MWNQMSVPASHLLALCPIHSSITDRDYKDTPVRVG
jgi:hypothetical protein